MSTKKAEEFGRKMAKAMLKIKSSHVYFLMQQAYKGKEYGKYGQLMSWDDAEEILREVVNEK